MAEYKILKVLSNNVILVDKNNKKFILTGKGIGFGQKKDRVITNPKNVEEMYISLDDSTFKDYENLLNTVDPNIIELTERIISMAHKELKEELNPHIHIGLIDHINFAIKRIEEGIDIVNPFLLETKLLYPDEYRLAEKSVNILREKLGIKIPDAEIGFIAFHFYGARKNKFKSDAFKNSKVVNRIISFTEKKLNRKLDKNSFDYIRFIMHLKGVLNRVKSGKCLENILLQRFIDEIPFEYKLAYDISKIVENELKVKVPEEEIGYIALHIHKLNKHLVKTN